VEVFTVEGTSGVVEVTTTGIVAVATRVVVEVTEVILMQPSSFPVDSEVHISRRKIA
jgi:hypothetical protein